MAVFESTYRLGLGVEVVLVLWKQNYLMKCEMYVLSQ